MQHLARLVMSIVHEDSKRRLRKPTIHEATPMHTYYGLNFSNNKHYSTRTHYSYTESVCPGYPLASYKHPASTKESVQLHVGRLRWEQTFFFYFISCTATTAAKVSLFRLIFTCRTRKLRVLLL